MNDNMESINCAVGFPADDQADGSTLDKAEEENVDVANTLPAEVWAAVMDCLDYSNVLSCAATSKTFLVDVMPLVKTLHIESAAQMNAVTPRRLRDVQEINIYSLLRQSWLVTVDPITVGILLVFLSHFNKLERVFLGGRDSSGGVITLQQCNPSTLSFFASTLKKLINNISEAYSSGYFSKELRILGLMCPCVLSVSATRCQVCANACRTWPLDSVLNFETQGPSIVSVGGSDFSYQRPCDLAVCIGRAQVESALQQRPGGNNLLRSKARLYHLLGQGKLFVIRSDEGDPLYIVIFYEQDLAEMNRVIMSSGTDVSKLTEDDILASIMRSFTISKDEPLPPRKLCYTNFTWCDFNSPVIANGENLLPQVVKGIRGESTISEECMYLLSRTLDSENPPIQKAIDLGVVPLLIDSFKTISANTTKNSFRSGAWAFTSVVASIAEHGTINHINLIMQAGVIPLIVEAIGDKNREVVSTACFAMSELIDKSPPACDCIKSVGVVTPLVRALDMWKDDIGVLYMASIVLSHICTVRPLSEFALVQPCIDPLCNLLMSSEEEDVLQNVCCALTGIADMPLVNRYELDIDAKVYRRLAGLLLHSSSNVQNEALILFGVIFENDLSIIDTLVPEFQDSALPKIVPFLSLKNLGTMTDPWMKQKTQLYACQVLNAVIQTKRESIRTLLEHDCIEMMAGVLLADAVVIVENGLSALKTILAFVREDPNQRPDRVSNDIKLIETKLGELERKREYSHKGFNALKDEIGIHKSLTKGSRHFSVG